MKRLLLIVLMIASFATYAQEKETAKEQQTPFVFPKLGVYLDCVFCDMTYLMQEMEFINFSRNPEDASVYVMVRTQMTGGGGMEYQLELTGQEEFKNITNSISFSTLSTNTQAETREELRNTLSMGLSTYYHQLMKITREQEEKEKEKAGELVEKKVDNSEEDKDPWNNWVFNMGVNGRMSGQESSKTTNYSLILSSKQVTEKHKFYLSARYDASESEFNYGDTIIISDKTTKSLRVSETISITNHWSVGAFIEMGGSDYLNMDFYFSLKPAIEYSFFDYKESSKKQVTLAYRVGRLYNDYIERTVFNKTTEGRWEQSISLGSSVKQKWGNLNGEIAYNMMLDEPSLYSFEFRAGMNVRLFKGFSMNVNGNYSITRNQINIAGRGVSQDQLLLAQKQVQSGYNFYTTIGFSYAFGSMFNTVVNPRFGF